jgi:hypothetical protein
MHQPQKDYWDIPQQELKESQNQSDKVQSDKTANLQPLPAADSSQTQNHQSSSNELRVNISHEKSPETPQAEVVSPPPFATSMNVEKKHSQIPNTLANEAVTHGGAVSQSSEEAMMGTGSEKMQNVDGHTLPAIKKTDEPQQEWTKPKHKGSAGDDMPSPPPMDVVPESNHALDRIWTVGWKKYFTDNKPATGPTTSNKSTKDTKLIIPSTTQIDRQNNQVEPRGYFPPAGTFPHTQSAEEIAVYPRTKTGLVTLARPEFTFSDQLVSEQALQQPVYQAATNSYYPPQKTGFRDFPEFSSSWK